MSSAEYRKHAADYCRPHTGILAVVFLINTLIVGAIDYGFSQILVVKVGENFKISYGSPIGGILTLWLGAVLGMGMIHIIKKMVENGEEPKVEDLFGCFKDSLNLFVLNLLETVFIFLWMLLFIIPGIVKALSYSMAFYIHDDNPSLSALECIDESKKLMKGHRMDLFLLILSYFGWFILCLLTFGILFLFVGPKYQTAHYLFYRNLVGVPALAEGNAEESAQ